MAQASEERIIEKMSEFFDTKLEPFIKQCRGASERALKAIDKIKREKNLVLFGIKEEDKEDTDKQVELVREVFNKLGVKDIIIDDIHRLGKKASDKKKAPRPLLVKLLTMIDKNRILRQKAKLKGQKIYINQDLSPEE